MLMRDRNAQDWRSRRTGEALQASDLTEQVYVAYRNLFEDAPKL